MANYYVNNSTGNNSNAGSLASPWATLAYAVGASSAAAAGDTIYLITTGSAYTGAPQTGKNGTSGSRIRVTSYTPYDPAIITPTNQIYIVHDYWTFENVIVTGSASYGFRLGNNTPITVTGITIQRCVIKHCVDAGIFNYSSNDIIIQDNLIYDCRTRVAGNGSCGIMTNSRMNNLTIQRNRIFDCGEDCIQWEQATVVNGDVRNNVLGRLNSSRYWQDFPAGTPGVGENGIDIKRVDGPLDIRHNIFFGFRENVAGQDNSGTSFGRALVGHIDTTGVTITRNCTYDCDDGFSFDQGSGAGFNADITADNNLFIRMRPGAVGLTARETTNFRARHNTFHGLPTYFSLGPDLDITSIANNLVTGGTGAGTGGYSRNSTGVAGEGNIANNAWHNLGSGPPSQWTDPGDVAISTLGLDAHYAPGGSSSALNAGTDAGILFDLTGASRDTSPALGAFEQFVAMSGSTNLLDFDGLALYWPGYFTSYSDADGNITPYPVAELDGEFGLAVKVDGSDSTVSRYAELVFADTATLRFAFWFEARYFQMTNGDRMSIVTVQGDGVRRAEVEVVYTSGAFYIAASTENDAGTTIYAGTSSGFSIDRGPHLVEVAITASSGPGANNGSIQLWIDDSSQGSSTTIDNDTIDFDALRFGAIGIDSTTGDPEEELGTFFLYDIRANNSGAAIAVSGSGIAIPALLADHLAGGLAVPGGGF